MYYSTTIGMGHTSNTVIPCKATNIVLSSDGTGGITVGNATVAPYTPIHPNRTIHAHEPPNTGVPRDTA